MRYLDANPAINNSMARQICHIGSENTVKRIFQRLIKENQIEPVPELRGSKTAYRKKGSVPNLYSLIADVSAND
jgi:ATP-dependent DNA helicase RecG